MRSIPMTLALYLVIAVPAISAAAIKAEVVKVGEEGQVSTIIGNGTASQGKYTVEGPRNLDVDGKKIYFVDGKHDKALLRVFDGKTNSTYVKLAGDEVAGKNSKYFVSTGLAVVDREVFVSSHVKLYSVKSKTLTKEKYLTHVSKLHDYMDKNGYDYIFRMEEYDKKLYFMLAKKNGTYGFVSYDVKDKTIIEELEPKIYPSSPNNFYVDEDGILIAFQSGVIQFEGLFPRRTIEVVETNTGSFLDAWTTQNGYLHYIELRDRTQNIIERRHRSDVDDLSLVAGSRRGYVDGMLDQVEMDGATDFVWDGSGYVFADKGNHAIRKLWVDTPPTSVVY